MDGNSRHPYSALIDALPIAAGLVDARGALVAANHAWATSGAPCSVAQPTEGAGYVGRLKQSSADGAAEVGAAITDALHAGQRPERITMADPDVPEDTTAAYIEVSVPGGSASAPIWRTRVAPAGDGLVLITHEDVSRSRQAQADLRKSRARLRTILTGAPLALFAVDTEGRFSLVEGMAAGAAGLITPEVVGRRVEEEYRHIPELVATVATALDGSTAVATVEVGALAFEVHCSPDIGGNGEFRGAVGIATDVTERVRAQRLKDDFVSVVNHELRTPLTSIHGALSLLENNVAGELPPEAVELTKIARTSVDRLIRMITDLLDLDRLDSGRFDLSRSRFDLGALAGDAVRELSALATDAEVEIETTACLSAFVEADRDRVHQVLTNLLSNAIKFSPVGGRVVVSMERRDGFLRVGVRDHGPGIRPEDRPRLFRKFSQLADPQSGSRRGSGLGLVISKSIVEAHGGRMTLESVVGEGSTFSFDLPVARVTTQTMPFRGAKAARSAPATGRPREAARRAKPSTPLDALLEMFAPDEADDPGRSLRDAHATVQLLLARSAPDSPPSVGRALVSLRSAIEQALDASARGAAVDFVALATLAGETYEVAWRAPQEGA